MLSRVNKKIIPLAAVISIFLCSGCSSINEGAAKAAPSSVQMMELDSKYKEKNVKDNYGITYEICPYSFADSNGDGIGDIKGIINNLDYLNDGDPETDDDLGVNGIWLTPVSKAYSYHKYDITDYKSIDPSFGTLADYDELVKKCHKRGMKVYYDLVINHTSDKHPWFKKAASYLRSIGDGDIDTNICPYSGFYNFSKEEKTGYVKLDGTSYYYEARFWGGMPDLNLDNDNVRQEIIDIMKFWIGHGVDGFRLDAVTSYYTGNVDKNIEFLKWLNDEGKKIKSDLYFVGEAWTNQATYAKLYDSGIDSFFDFDYADSSGVVAKTTKGIYTAEQFAKSLSDSEQLYSEHNPNMIDAPFYTNHDMARSSGYYMSFKNAKTLTKVSGALNLLMKGNAFVYYGEELGMKGSGKDENKRQPMYWTRSKSGSYSKIMCDPVKGSDQVKMEYPPFDKQKDDPLSIYNYYKTAMHLRESFPEISEGDTIVNENLSKDGVAVVEKGEVCLVINLSKKKKTVDLSKTEFKELSGTLNVSKARVEMKDGKITIPSYDIALITKK